MEKLKSEVKVVRTMNVYSTKNYEYFNISEINRNIKPSQVRVIKNSIISQGQQKPIVLDNDFYIIDGQHRYTALKELNLPIEFIISNRSGNTIKDKMSIMESQNTSFSWSYMEKLVLRAKIDDNYLRLKILIDKYGFSLSATLDILFNKRTHIKASQKMGNISIGFLENNLIVTEEMVSKSINRFDKFKKLKEINNLFLSTQKSRTLLSLVKNQNLDLDVLISKSQKNSGRIDDLCRMNKTVDFIEKLYNFNSKKPTYFIDPKKYNKLINK